jgi:glycerol-3-phosphate dehydrogenase
MVHARASTALGGPHLDSPPSGHVRTCDLLVIGGGINGTGIARDATGRGLNVVLCERGDLAGATSSASTKLIHGGLRYLEHYEFRLVREALAERETLLRMMPHIARPMRFVLPHHADMRPRWMIRLGLFLYDHLSRRSRLEGSRRIDLRKAAEGRALNSERTSGFVYSDCCVDDARLVVLNALDAAERGASILTRTICANARRHRDHWMATLVDGDGASHWVRARAIVNATGPWATDVQSKIIGESPRGHMRLVQGSHIVVPKLFDGDHGYILQNPDKRIVFAIPYEGRFTLIGTTDVDYAGDPAKVRISDAEAAYLCTSVNRYMAKQISPSDVVWAYSGVRPLYDDATADPAAITRDYVFEVTGGGDEAPLLTIFGGKLTTYRRLAENALQKLAPLMPIPVAGWTAGVVLPGGDFPGGDFARFLAAFRARHPWLPGHVAERFAHSYGTRAEMVLGDAGCMADLGQHFGAGLYEREVEYLITHEWACDADDILLRRTKLALHGGPRLRTALNQWLAGRARQHSTRHAAAL